MKIAVANTKGGVGKSTLSMHLMHALHILYPDKRVLLFDADPQGSCLNWRKWRSAAELMPYFDVQPLHEEGMKMEMQQKEKEFDFIIVDVGGTDNKNLRRSLTLMDAVIIPTSLDPSERIHNFDMLDLVAETLSVINPALKCFIVFNKIKAGTQECQLVDEFKADFPDYVQWIDSFVMSRVKFSRVYGQGKTVFDLVEKETDPKAEQEIMNVMRILLEKLEYK